MAGNKGKVANRWRPTAKFEDIKFGRLNHVYGRSYAIPIIDVNEKDITDQLNKEERILMRALGCDKIFQYEQDKRSYPACKLCQRPFEGCHDPGECNGNPHNEFDNEDFEEEENLPF